MPKRKPEPVLVCRFAEDGEELLDIICRCFRSFLYKEFHDSAKPD